MDHPQDVCRFSMSGSTMFNIAYGLRCDSNEDPMLTRMEELATAIDSIPSRFLVVSSYAYGKNSAWRAIYRFTRMYVQL
jgi:hypothetical protein